VLGASDIGDLRLGALPELSVSRYDEAVVSLGLMVRFDELLFEGRPASISLFNNFQTEID